MEIFLYVTNSPGDSGSGPTLRLSCKKLKIRDFSLCHQRKALCYSLQYTNRGSYVQYVGIDGDGNIEKTNKIKIDLTLIIICKRVVVIKGGYVGPTSVCV